MELKVGSIPVRIHGRFLLMALFLGMAERDPVKLGIWVVVVLVSVIIHELGHAFMGKAFGLIPQVELHGMGGHTLFTGGPMTRGEVGTGKSIAISLAGPFAGFFFALVVFAFQLGGWHPTHPLARHAVSLLFFVNIGWGIFNLVPMLPLDGGNVLRAALRALSSKNGEKIARVVSVVFAVTIALWSIGREQWWVLYLGVSYAFQNVQALRQSGQLRIDQALAEAIEKSYGALDRNEPNEAIGLLAPVLRPEASGELRQLGVRVQVVAMMKAGLWPEALDVMERERNLIGADELARFAQSMRDVGREQEAERAFALAKEPAPLASFRA